MNQAELVPRLTCRGTQAHRHDAVEMSVARADDDVRMRCPVCEAEVTT